MEFLIIALLGAFSCAACFFPQREKYVRVWFVGNATVLALALAAFVVPNIGEVPREFGGGLFVVDSLRGMLAIALGMSWVGIVSAFALWWGACFAEGVGSRQLFTVRSATLVGAFLGVLAMLFANNILVVAGGLLLTGGMVCAGSLYEAKQQAREKLLIYTKGTIALLGGIIAAVLLLIAMLYGSTGEFVLTVSHAREVVMGSKGVAVVVISIAAAMYALLGVLPFFAWQRQGARELPKAQQLIMRAFLPTALLPHVLGASAWAGADAVAQTIFFVGSIATFGALLQKIHEKEDGGALLVTLLIMGGSASMSYGVAGAIPTAMFGIVGVLFATMFTLAQGGVWWSARVRTYACALCVGVPVVSPLFIPFMLSVGYGLQMKPVFAGAVAAVSAYALFIIATRLRSAWTEETPRYAEQWMGKIAVVFLALLTVYGVWFLHADALGLVVNAVDSV